MASKIAHHSLCAHTSHEEGIDFLGTGDNCCGKVRWNTVRQGDILINGVFCEHEIYASDCNYDDIGSEGASESWINGHSEVDWYSKDIAIDELICNESSNYSDLQTGKKDFSRDEKDVDIVSTLTAVAALVRDWCTVGTDLSDPLPKEGEEISSKMEKDKRMERTFIDNIKSETSSNALDAFTALSRHNGLLHRNWSTNNNHARKELINAYLENQNLLRQAFINQEIVDGEEFRTIKWNVESKWVPDVAVQNLSQEEPRALPGCASTDVCPSRSGPEFHGIYPSHYDREMAEMRGGCNKCAVGSDSFGRDDEENGEGKELFDSIYFENGHAVHLEQKSLASRYSFAYEDEKSALGAVLPLTIERQKQSDKVRLENNLVVATDNFKFDVVISNEGENKLGILPAEALFYALPYMGLQDILSMERVCKSLRDWIRSDVLLWQQLHVEPPLSKKFSDEALLQLTSRSKGQLQCLSMVDCLRITEGAVEQVVYSNPRLSKLCLPGCSRVSADAVVRIVKTHTDSRVPGMTGLKQLRIRNIYGLTREHLESLLTLLGNGEQVHSAPRKPQFYHNGHYSSFCDDQKLIDVELCPKCTNVRLVYDCTRERCQQRQGSKFEECRACILCIIRCEECGKCIDDNEYEETFCLDLLCSSCWLRLPKCSECNRPGCGRHADHFIRTPETTFVCSDCCGSSPGASGPEFHVYA